MSGVDFSGVSEEYSVPFFNSVNKAEHHIFKLSNKLKTELLELSHDRMIAVAAAAFGIVWQRYCCKKDVMFSLKKTIRKEE